MRKDKPHRPSRGPSHDEVEVIRRAIARRERRLAKFADRATGQAEHELADDLPAQIARLKVILAELAS